ncbi:hypothetical protein GUITHDRAFT_142600 [Guillardia theta CCMP2712]|uniref:Uncharacterized protein n=1 Tax=Guillardia theta (strain CCMP2712) TaxID=905079 RepID=L1IWT8_GUITC|nr:hypothetical protein GUITHDRAFT_142600 [Guillardia theta CCMP2712]EKX40738.1 hypothetical protein GUITHDRAFT_142600 [Guillardia theta CCMP2712]|eukprot:XP_005827718.1 hypothetical protein GUITHDRAFT_142600 [Guillardia theta CCMP2712]
MLFFSTSKADLGLTLIVAAVLSLLTLVIFKLDNDVKLLEYNKDMRQGNCKVLSAELQHVSVPQGPPDVDIPDEDKWRGEVIVEVDPGDGANSFQVPVHDTLEGQFSSVKEYQEQWLQRHQEGKQEVCYYGMFHGHMAAVFDLQAALTKVNGSWGEDHSSFSMHVAKVVVGFFALLFVGLVLIKLLVGKWDSPEDEEYQQLREDKEDAVPPYGSDGTRGGGEEERLQRVVVDLQEERRGNVETGRSLILQGGTPRSDGLEEVPLPR